MVSELKPGEYVDKCGHVWAWRSGGGRWVDHVGPTGEKHGPFTSNLRAAAAALVALADELETEYVELGENHRIVTRNGETWLEYWGVASESWRKHVPGETEVCDAMLAAYHAGLGKRMQP